MAAEQNRSLKSPIPARRQIITWGAFVLGGLAVSPIGSRAGEDQGASPCPTKDANPNSSSIHQEIDFKANAGRIYRALLDSKQFAAFTGSPAEIQPDPGATFTCFAGRIMGRHIELKPDQRIVQAWRVDSWPDGVYSIVKFELKSQGTGTRLILDHAGYPEGSGEHLASGWKMRYWEPLEKYLA